MNDSVKVLQVKFLTFKTSIANEDLYSKIIKKC